MTGHAAGPAAQLAALCWGLRTAVRSTAVMLAVLFVFDLVVKAVVLPYHAAWLLTGWFTTVGPVVSSAGAAAPLVLAGSLGVAGALMAQVASRAGCM